MSHVTHMNESCHIWTMYLWYVIDYIIDYPGRGVLHNSRRLCTKCPFFFWGGYGCGVLRCVAVCFCVLRCVAVCFCVLRCVAVCFCVLWCVAEGGFAQFEEIVFQMSLFICLFLFVIVAECCGVIWWGDSCIIRGDFVPNIPLFVCYCCGVLWCVAVCCSVCCSELQTESGSCTFLRRNSIHNIPATKMIRCSVLQSSAV